MKEEAMAMLKKSVLYDRHTAAGARMAEFAGYMMPLWYSSISEEHRAVRERAGLFDCTHMGVLELAGGGAASFLEAVVTNRVGGLSAGQAKYNFMADEEGKIIDDLIAYRRGVGRYLLVVNAANDAADQAHLREAIKSQRQYYHGKAAMRDLRAESSGSDRRVNIALQGPASLEALERWAGAGNVVDQAMNMKSLEFFETQARGVDLIVSRTGYTGSRIGFELLVHPDQAVEVWDGLLAAGEPVGLRRCGLGARDSLRIEAGFPLYGHELAGEYDISPFEAGYGWAVKPDKGYFVGREALAEKAGHYKMQVIRVSFGGGKGVRPLRAGDAMLDIGENGGASPTLPTGGNRAGNEYPTPHRCAGWLTSVAGAGDRQIGLAYIERDRFLPGDAIGGYYLARSAQHVAQGRCDQVPRGATIAADVVGTVLERFEKF
jgi:glycine cleavage system T protein